MKRIFAVLIGCMLLLSACIAYASPCNTPQYEAISFGVYSSGQEYAKTRIDEIGYHNGCNYRDNVATVSITVQVGVRPGTATTWYSTTSTTKQDCSEVIRIQSVTPTLHYLKGAKGNWEITCNLCDIAVRTRTDSIPYESYNGR